MEEGCGGIGGVGGTGLTAGGDAGLGACVGGEIA